MALDPPLEKNIKAISPTLLRRWIRETPGAYERFAAQLSGADQRLFESFGATDWISADATGRFYEVGARLLYPDESSPQRRLGREFARSQLRGVYRFLLQIISVNTLIDRTAALWSRNHRVGQAWAERVSDGTARICVKGHPRLPLSIRENTAGYICGAVELTGATNVRVFTNNDPECWIWTVTWR
jgi:hypothetical protein